MTRIITQVMKYEYSTGFLWWKKWFTEEYYYWRGSWYNKQNHQIASDKMQRKLTHMWLCMDKFRVDFDAEQAKRGSS